MIYFSFLKKNPKLYQVNGMTSILFSLLSLSLDSECHQTREITLMLLAAGAHVSIAVYAFALQGHVPEHLPLILEHAGLPEGKRLQELAHKAIEEVQSASFWLPLVLKAGMDPMLLLQNKIKCKADTPESLIVEDPVGIVESVPALAHLCRLAVRASVGSNNLSKSSFIQQLPVPTLLQDFLQFSDVTHLLS
ncbi:hypothetical protein DNTS_002580 [Danionella cerebrum]|uniref:SOCS box domain-containing protein n=1 Tax=Danionella cerebrum TaxID=2873325 RepID=A0A553RPP0_9TELE|nr:hypothetical protein DNTS_002580 [Danionella translucida]